MTILLGVDIETSGLDPKEDKILEVGIVVKKHGEDRPMYQASHYIYDPNWGANFISQEAFNVNAIHSDYCRKFGIPLAQVAQDIERLIKVAQVDYLVGHNALGFDKGFMETKFKSLGMDFCENFINTPWIDTMIDPPFPKSVTTRKLTYLAAEYGFLNFLPHAALSDVFCCLKLLDKFDIDEVIERASSPSAIYKAVVPHPKNDGGKGKDRAKSLGFKWQGLEGRSFPFTWVRRIKDCEFETLVANLGYEVRKIDE